MSENNRNGFHSAFVPLLLLAVSFLMPTSVCALPWDIDMYRQQSLKANEIARNPAEGSVQLGRRPRQPETPEEIDQVSNPVPFGKESVRRGARTWRSNCYPCHGRDAAGGGPVAAHFVGIPNLLGDLYKQRSDGHVFGVIYFGQNSMPRYGYKFSDQQQWDVVNYLRFLQGIKSVEGMSPPEAIAAEPSEVGTVEEPGQGPAAQVPRRN